MVLMLSFYIKEILTKTGVGLLGDIIGIIYLWMYTFAEDNNKAILPRHCFPNCNIETHKKSDTEF